MKEGKRSHLGKEEKKDREKERKHKKHKKRERKEKHSKRKRRSRSSSSSSSSSSEDEGKRLIVHACGRAESLAVWLTRHAATRRSRRCRGAACA